MIPSFFSRFLVVIILLLIGCSGKRSESPSEHFSCKEYTWSDIQTLVEPYISGELYTSLVMQGQSSDYKVSAAADHAIALSESYPDSVLILLRKIQKADC
jgi:outer membrane biogenesis lipoprotein LolB